MTELGDLNGDGGARYQPDFAGFRLFFLDLQRYFEAICADLMLIAVIHPKDEFERPVELLHFDSEFNLPFAIMKSHGAKLPTFEPYLKEFHALFAASVPRRNPLAKVENLLQTIVAEAVEN